jgi:hypothetical protein
MPPDAATGAGAAKNQPAIRAGASNEMSLRTFEPPRELVARPPGPT